MLNNPITTRIKETYAPVFLALNVMGNCMLLNGRASDRQIKPGIKTDEDSESGDVKKEEAGELMCNQFLKIFKGSSRLLEIQT